MCVCAISSNSVEQFWRIRFSMVCITSAMFKSALSINLLLIYMAPPLEQTLITLNQGLFVCNIQECCSVVLEKKIFKGLHSICYVQIVFGYYYFQSILRSREIPMLFPRPKRMASDMKFIRCGLRRIHCIGTIEYSHFI